MDIQKQFFSASDGKVVDPDVDPEKALSQKWNAGVRALAEILDEIPDGRNKSIAITHLEDVQMRGNRAIFDPQSFSNFIR